MGRARKILDLNNRHFTKAEIDERRATESSFKSGRDQLLPPEFLSERAKAEFNRIINIAYWIDNLDRNDLILYCFYWDKALGVVESKVYDDLDNNPLRRAIKDYHAEMRAISLKLGLSAIDRLKLVAPKKEKPVNKFLKDLS